MREQDRLSLVLIDSNETQGAMMSKTCCNWILSCRYLSSRHNTNLSSSVLPQIRHIIAECMKATKEVRVHYTMPR